MITKLGLTLAKTDKICSASETKICWPPVSSHLDERLVITNANDVGRVEKKATQCGMTEWGRKRDEKKPFADSSY